MSNRIWWFVAGVIALTAPLEGTPSTYRPTATDPNGGETSGSQATVANPANAWDNNVATSAGLTASRPWTLGAGSATAKITYVGFTDHKTPVKMRVYYDAYADGGATCPAEFKGEYWDGTTWHTVISGYDDTASWVQRNSGWSSDFTLAQGIKTGEIKFRATAQVSRTGCGFFGPYAYMHIGEVELVADDCAIPFDLSQFGSAFYTNNNTALSFNYHWKSSTGYPTDLGACSFVENLVNSPWQFANPPFPANFPSSNTAAYDANLDWVATTGGGTDDHKPPLQGFVTPYTTASGLTSQIYLFRCPCYSNNNNVPIGGPFSITRTVTQNGDGTWKYTVTKSDGSLTISPLP